MIIGDDSQLENAFMNIAINASHVMLNGGELLFETKSINFDDNYCQKSPFDISKGDFIEIKITGLGLSAVYNTIKTHNGEIKVESEIGVGTTFFMYLPCTERKKEIVKEDSLIFSEEKEKLILLVDDEEVIRITGKYILKKLGYSVLTAEDGVEAIEIYKNNKDSIDLIIMDMIMPKMNGAEAFSMLRKINNNCKVIISSGFTRDENLIELKEVGLIGFLAKPFSIDELKSILKKVFSENT
jgi:CheY-like chemotaxis protein